MNTENRSRYHTSTRVKSKTHILMLQLARPWASLVPALPLSLKISLSLSPLPRHTAALSLALSLSLCQSFSSFCHVSFLSFPFLLLSLPFSLLLGSYLPPGRRIKETRADERRQGKWRRKTLVFCLPPQALLGLLPLRP